MKRVVNKLRVGELLDLLNENEGAAELMYRLQQTNPQTESAAAFEAGFLFGELRANKEAVAKLADAGLLGDVGSLGFYLRAPSPVDELPDYVAGLVQDGVLLNVRRCAVCKRWMFADRKDRRACSAACRHKQYEQKPESKDRRNAYMRWRYATQDSTEWRDSGIPRKKWPTFNQWLEHKEPTAREWAAILKGVKL